MGGRNRNRTVASPSALGDIHVDAAITTIGLLCQKTMAVMTEYPFTREQTIPMLFPVDVLNRAMAAKDLINAASDTLMYEIAGAELHMNYTAGIESPWPAINDTAMALQPTAAPLLDFIKQVRAIHEQFEEIKGVLRWLNRHATPGAIRFYFPTASALCPDSPPLKTLPHVPSRYTQPPGINDWMQLIKDASALYAGTQMLPVTTRPRVRNRGMWLTFPREEILRGPVGFYSDMMTYNL